MLFNHFENTCFCIQLLCPIKIKEFRIASNTLIAYKITVFQLFSFLFQSPIVSVGCTVCQSLYARSKIINLKIIYKYEKRCVSHKVQLVLYLLKLVFQIKNYLKKWRFWRIILVTYVTDYRAKNKSIVVQKIMCYALHVKLNETNNVW